MISGVVGAVVLTLVSLTAVVFIVVVMGRKVQKWKAELAQRSVESPERSGTIELGQAAGQKGTKEKAYEYACVKSSATGRQALYQELDVRTQDYVSVYDQLRGEREETYQELDSRSSEEEHHYQSVN